MFFEALSSPIQIKLFLSFNFFYEKLISRCVFGHSGIANSTVHTKDIFVENKGPQDSVVFFQSESFTQECLLNCTNTHLSGFFQTRTDTMAIFVEEPKILA